jgi:hypothetical protein
MKALLINFWQRFHRPLSYVLIYALACKAFHTLLYTAVTSFVLAAGKSGLDLSNVVNEIASQFTLIAYAGAAVVVSLTNVWADQALQRRLPFWNALSKPAWQLERSSKIELYRGASSGFFAIFILLLIMLVARQINFLGLFITSTVGTPVFPLFIANTAALFCLIFAEEYIFRFKILNSLCLTLQPVHAIALHSVAYIFVKYVQFDLMFMDMINLFLLNMCLGFFQIKSGKMHRGLGFLIVLFGFTHTLAGLPLWQHISPSVFLFKHSTRNSVYLTGGDAGPMASFGVSGILLFLFISSYISWQRESEDLSHRRAGLN